MKKEMLFPIAIVGLSVFFGFISILVYLRPSPTSVKIKLKLGALLLSFTMLTSCAGDPPEETCYKTAFVCDTIASDDTVATKAPSTDTTSVKLKSKKKKVAGTNASCKDTIATKPEDQMIRCYAPPANLD
jgi:hypothetical protein